MRIFDTLHSKLMSLGLGRSSRAQQETDLWIGQNSLRRSLMAFLLMGLGEAAWVGGNSGAEISRRPAGCYNSCPRETMSNLAKAVQQLHKERDQARRRVEQLDEALKALGSLDGLRGRVGRVRRAQTLGRKRRTMPAAARKRIAAAQRARWAKWKAARRNK